MRVFPIVFLLFFSCVDTPKTLPGAIGKNSEVVFVVDDILWENHIDSLVANSFGANIKGISKSESLFSIIRVNHREFKSILKSHTNIVLVLEGSKERNQNNKWANNQLVASLNWDGNLNSFSQELLEIKEIFISKEIRSIRNNFKKKSQKNIEKNLLDSFGKKFIVPKKYSIIINDSTLFWGNYNPKGSDEIKNIFVFSFIPQTLNLQREVLFKTDSLFAKHLLGAREGSFVCIEKDYPPYYFQNMYRGLWRLHNGFMGGPFLIKTSYKGDKVVVSLGLVFSPQSKKRAHIKEFEAIL